MLVKKMIGLSGYAGSGKDTVAEILRSKYGYVRFAFGDHIRKDMSQWWIFGLNGPVPDRVRRTLDNVKQEERIRAAIWQKPTTPELREALQWWGQYRRWLSPLVWVNSVRQEIIERDSPSTRVVISDIRFPTDYHMIKTCHGEVWRIERGMPINSDVSETAIDLHDFDAHIHNDKDINDLGLLVREVLKDYDKEAVDGAGRL